MKIQKTWWFWTIIVAVVAITAFIIIKPSFLDIGSISLKDCKCSKFIRCEPAYECIIPEGENCGVCEYKGGSGGGDEGGSQPSQ